MKWVVVMYCEGLVTHGDEPLSLMVKRRCDELFDDVATVLTKCWIL